MTVYELIFNIVCAEFALKNDFRKMRHRFVKYGQPKFTIFSPSLICQAFSLARQKARKLNAVNGGYGKGCALKIVPRCI